MTKRKILIWVSILCGIIAFILLFNFYVKGYHLYGGILFDLFASFFVGIIIYVFSALIFKSLDKDFAQELNDKNYSDAIKFFENNKLKDGTYIESFKYHKPSKTFNILNSIVLVIIILVGTFAIAPHYFTSYKYAEYLAVIFIVIYFITMMIQSFSMLFNLSKIEARQGDNEYFKVYKDKFVLYPKNETLNFSDLDQIEISNNFGTNYINFVYGSKNSFFQLNSAEYVFQSTGLLFPYFESLLKQLGFVFVKHISYDPTLPVLRDVKIYKYKK